MCALWQYDVRVFAEWGQSRTIGNFECEAGDFFVESVAWLVGLIGRYRIRELREIGFELRAKDGGKSGGA
jgi:hypothetical protein